MSKKPNIPVQPIDFESLGRAIQEHASERAVPMQVIPKPAVLAAPSTPPASPMRKFTVELPDYVIEEIQKRAHDAKPRATTRYIVMLALQEAGIAIHPEDLRRDGRRAG